MTTTQKNGRELWKILAVISLTANVTGVGTWLSFGMHSISRAEAVKITREQSPWPKDKGIVMGHLQDRVIHEDDTVKRQRIRDELSAHIAPLEMQLSYITKELTMISEHLKTQ